MSGNHMLRLWKGTERAHELVRRSNERIRMSLELLDRDVPSIIRRPQTPICEVCSTRMAWFRSILNATERIVIHVFACPRCGATAEIETPAELRFEG